LCLWTVSITAARGARCVLKPRQRNWPSARTERKPTTGVRSRRTSAIAFVIHCRATRVAKVGQYWCAPRANRLTTAGLALCRSCAVTHRMGLQDPPIWRVLPKGRSDILFQVACDRAALSRIDSVARCVEPLTQPGPECDAVRRRWRERHRAEAGDVLMAHLAVQVAGLDQAGLQAASGLAEPDKLPAGTSKMIFPFRKKRSGADRDGAPRSDGLSRRVTGRAGRWSQGCLVGPLPPLQAARMA
jgi:hypothetical protein